MGKTIYLHAQTFAYLDRSIIVVPSSRPSARNMSLQENGMFDVLLFSFAY